MLYHVCDVTIVVACAVGTTLLLLLFRYVLFGTEKVYFRIFPAMRIIVVVVNRCS